MRRLPRAIILRYARSLFAVAAEQQAVEAVRSDLSDFNDLWKANPDLALLILNPSLSQPRIEAILNSLLARLGAHEVTRKFVGLLREKKRLEVLYDIAPVFEQMWREHRGEIAVEVTTAVEVAEPLREQIRSHLSLASGKSPLITWRIDPLILGGIVVRWPDHVYDGSLSRKLENLTLQMAGAA